MDNLVRPTYIPTEGFFSRFFDEFSKNISAIINELVKDNKNLIALSLSLISKMIIKVFDMYIKHHLVVAEQHINEKLKDYLIRINFLELTVRHK